MKNFAINGAIAALTLLISAGTAAACPTYVSIDNESDVDINILSCGTKKQGADKWHANFICFEDMLSQDKISPGKGWIWKLNTSRNANTMFKVRVTYHYGEKGPVKTSESDYAKCSSGHAIVIN